MRRHAVVAARILVSAAAVGAVVVWATRQEAATMPSSPLRLAALALALAL